MRVFQLSTYPIDNPVAGGSLRCFALRAKLRSANVKVESYIFTPGPKEFRKGKTFYLSTQGLIDVAHDGMTSDVAVKEYFQNRPTGKIEFYNTVLKSQPDVFLVEQPYLWFLIEEMRAIGIIKDQLCIYSSHNIESPMKNKIYSRSYKEKKVRELTQSVRSLEAEAIQNADLVFCVSKSDRNQTLKIIGKSNFRKKKVLVYENGTYQAPLKKVKPKQLKKIVFVGSAHPPNFYGITEFFDSNKNEMIKNSQVRFEVAGSVCSLLEPWLKARPYFKNLLKLNGIVSKKKLSKILQEADGIILPLKEGGGSNLKTTEALASGKCIFATTKAGEGFSLPSRVPGLYVTNNFKKMYSDCCEFSSRDRIFNRDHLRITWDVILKDLPTVVKRARGKK
jgi:glycosyltransferase involved in cell wall biosynthesis